MNYLTGVNVGASNTKAVLYDQGAQVITQANYGYELYRNAAGMAEQKPEEVISTAEQTIHDVATTADFGTGKLLVVSVSSTNQSLFLLDKNEKPLSRLITWVDSRAQNAADNLKAMTEGQQLYMKTGVPVHPMSTLTKLLWLREDEPDLFNHAAYFADIKAYPFYRLLNEFKVDMLIAPSIDLMNLKTCDWDDQVLRVAGIIKDQPLEIVDRTTQVTGLVPEAQEKLGVPADTPLVYGAYDSAPSNIGVGTIKQNTVAITIGASAAVRVATDHPVISPERCLFYYAINKGLQVIDGPPNNDDGVCEWAAKHLINSGAVKDGQADPYILTNHIIEGAPTGAHGLLFHPFLGGERAPLWNAKTRGSFFGPSHTHTRADMLRAVMEGISINIVTVFQVVRALVGESASATAMGGSARSKVWRQMFTDILNYPINAPDSFESGCLRPVVVTIQGLGTIDSPDTPQKFTDKVSSYQPDPAAVKVYQRYTPLFQQIRDMLAPAYPEVARLQGRQDN